MNKFDYEEVRKHINILNVAYHLCLEITDRNENEAKAICPFCGYNKNSKIATLILNTGNNKYHCQRCERQGYSLDLYAKVKNIDKKQAYKELLDRECFSPNKNPIKISPFNMLATIEERNEIYRAFLNMLDLKTSHRHYLRKVGMLNSTIEENLYRTIPNKYILRRIIAYNLSKEFDLCGIPGFYQEEDEKWCFGGTKGFFIPVFDNNGYIQGLSAHLDKEYRRYTRITIFKQR